MELALDEEHALLREVVREFVAKELLPLEGLVGDEGLSADLAKRLSRKTKEMGLWLLDVPVELGGAGLDVLGRAIVFEETARSTAVRPRRRGIYGPDVSAILFECNEAQREQYLYPVLRGERVCCFALTEVEAGSDPSSMRTTAVRRDNQYVINGDKHFITRSHDADFIILVALTDPAKRARGGMSCFLVDMDTPGVRRGERWPMLMGDAPGDLHFDNVQISIENRLGEEGRGFVQAQRFLTAARIVAHAARCVGMAQRALDMMLTFAPQRVTFGQPLSERQAIQFMIADSAIEVHAARLMLYHCAQQFDRGVDVRDESYMLKVYTSEMCHRVVDRALQMHGGMGLSKALPLEILYREARMYRITEGSAEVLRWRLARNLLRN